MNMALKELSISAQWESVPMAESMLSLGVLLAKRSARICLLSANARLTQYFNK